MLDAPVASRVPSEPPQALPGSPEQGEAAGGREHGSGGRMLLDSSSTQVGYGMLELKLDPGFRMMR
jgi:hypothetical protein